VEGSLRRVSGALGQARDDRRQLQRDHDAVIERLTTEMAQLTCQRDQATQRTVVFEGRRMCTKRAGWTSDHRQ
jgi:GTP cyclohydrolase I